MPACVLRLQSEQLEHRPHEDIDAGRKKIRAEKGIPMRAVPLCLTAEIPHQRLQQKLKSARDGLKFRDRENPDRRGEQEHRRRDEKCRYQPRVDEHSEQRDPIPLMQYRILHHV